jgi:hypothetical protein
LAEIPRTTVLSVIPQFSGSPTRGTNHTAKTLVEAVNKTPEFRQLADTVIQAVQTKLRQRRQAKEPTASPS